MEENNSSPDPWIFHARREAKCSWTDEESRSSSHSLKIDFGNKNGYSSDWNQLIEYKLPYGKKPVLRVFIKTVNVEGYGGAISVKGYKKKLKEFDKDTKYELWVSTWQKVSIKGSHDWKEYTLEFDKPLTYDIKSLVVSLGLGDYSKGAIYFDDVIFTY